MQGKWKKDITIGYRAFEELLRVYGTVNYAQLYTGFSINMIYGWRTGSTPRQTSIERMAQCGCDAEYILTGIRKGEQVSTWDEERYHDMVFKPKAAKAKIQKRDPDVQALSAEIGNRAYEEAIRVFGKAYRAYTALAIGEAVLRNYKEGGSPNSVTLKKMHDAGMDIMYILTGERRETNA